MWFQAYWQFHLSVCTVITNYQTNIGNEDGSFLNEDAECYEILVKKIWFACVTACVYILKFWSGERKTRKFYVWNVCVYDTL